MERERQEYVSQLIGREKLRLAGVREITEFDDEQVIADSDLGRCV